MSPAQMFHLPAALRRTRSVAVGKQRRQTDRREAKLHDVLGVTEADINTARNQSISSAATTKLQSNSLSDATTEAGHSPSYHDKVPQIPELHLKASSVLLHDEFEQGPDTASSTRSVRLKNYDSSSTLHSHYDAHKAPLAVSQQTSDSSRRDFALRKEKPVVVKSTTREQDSQRQLKGLKSSRPRSAVDSKKLRKTRPQTGHTLPPESVTPTDWRSVVDQPSTPKTAKSTKSTKSWLNTSKTYKGAHFNHPPPVPSPATDSRAMETKTMNSLLEPMDPACVKVNIRRPKVGAKYWFDGLEGDSSEDESTDEPVFQQNFVLGIETAFQNDQIRAISSDTSTVTTRQLSSTISSDSAITPRSRYFPPRQLVQEIAPRIATLSAKASKPNLSSISQSQSQKSRSDLLVDKDLNQSSVLNLSSSEDEDEALPTQGVQPALSGPVLRNSVAIAFHNDSQVELGMAKAVGARQTMKRVESPRIKKLKAAEQQPSREQLRMPIPKRGSSLMLSYLNDQSEAPDGSTDLLASFPATPVEGLMPSHRTSIRSSVALSDAGSMESRRLMSVTRQEETLLAAMRLKKAAMRYHVTQDKRLEALQSLERGHSRLSERTAVGQQSFPSISQLSLDTHQPFESARTSQWHHHRRASNGDAALQSRVSGTTFQTTTSRNASRMSRLTFQTEVSADPQTTRLSLSSSNDSEQQSAAPSLLSLSTADRRQSRDTFFSTSSAGHGGGGGHSRTLTINSHVVALDDLEKVPKRDGIPSQEFIDWPYKGWEDLPEARAELALAR